MKMFAMKLWFVAALTTLAYAQFNSEYASLFTDDELETIMSQRVRKEIRDLSTEEWQRIVDAMWVMKNTAKIDGEAIYGDNFRNYDQLVCQHSRSGTSDGNIGHSVASFPTFHRAMHLEFEESVMAIDGRIEAVPYLDLRLDVDDLENSVIFSDDYFGSINGNSDEDHIVTDGKFAYWRVAMNRNSETCPGGDINNFGYLRSNYSVGYQKYAVRYGSHFCANEGKGWDDVIDDWDSCLETDMGGDMYVFLQCFDKTTHAMAHHFIGGTWLRDDQNDSSLCLDWFSNIKLASACDVDCPECVTGVDNWSDCFCSVTTQATIDPLTPSTTDNCNSLNADLNTAQLFGDFEDLAHSPNDPIFFFHHMNIDRLFFTWELMNHEYESDYFNFPTQGELLGINLDDVCGYLYPFTNIWDDDNKPYTNRDILDNTRIAVNTYQYDTVIQMIIGDDIVDDTDETIVTATLSRLSVAFNDSQILVWAMLCAAAISAMFMVAYYRIYGRNKMESTQLTDTDVYAYGSF